MVFKPLVMGTFNSVNIFYYIKILFEIYFTIHRIFLIFKMAFVKYYAYHIDL